MEDGAVKFYGRFIDDTLVVIKPKDIVPVNQALINFDKNLRFIIDSFEKLSNTGQYVNYSSNISWVFQTSWIKSLATGAKNICSLIYLKGELNSIKRCASWNGFPKYITNKIIKQIISKTTTVDKSAADSDPETIIWF